MGNDFSFELEVKNQEFLMLNKSIEQVACLVDDMPDMIKRATENLIKHKTENEILKIRRKTLLKFWSKVERYIAKKSSAKIEYFKRPNNRGIGEDVFYIFIRKMGLAIEYQNTTGEMRFLESGTYLGNLIPITEDEANELVEKFESICAIQHGVYR